MENNEVALIISGELRNFKTAALSLHAWNIPPENRFLLTWDNADPTEIKHYQELSGITDQNIILSKNVKYKLEFHQAYQNAPKMMFHWRSLSKLKGRFKRYILIRPDCFYWINDNFDATSLESGLRSYHPNPPTFIQDLVFSFDDEFLPIIASMSQNLGHLFISGVHHEVHKAMAEYLKHLDTHSEYLARNLKYILIVRPTFKPQDTDSYNEDLFVVLFYDTAAWWRRKTGLKYSQDLVMPDYMLKEY